MLDHAPDDTEDEATTCLTKRCECAGSQARVAVSTEIAIANMMENDYCPDAIIQGMLWSVFAFAHNTGNLDKAMTYARQFETSAVALDSPHDTLSLIAYGGSPISRQ